MNYLDLLLLCSLIGANFVHGQSNCVEGWEQYKDEKCFKIIPDAIQNYEGALDLCHKQGEGVTLLTIHSQPEQDFLSDLLFTKHKVVDTVWIGAQVSNKKVTWVDGSKDDYTNWESGDPSNATENCVELDPKAPNTGKWVDEPCAKKNQVVCQNGQLWSREHMQQMIVELRQNIIPMGFIYVQLPNQPEPKVLWPTMDWDNVTPSYAGLFFRAEGSGSEKFNGNVQQEDSPRLVTVQMHYDMVNETSHTVYLKPGVFSNDLYTGTRDGKLFNFFNFLVSAAEVRPRNQAMRVWKRIK